MNMFLEYVIMKIDVVSFHTNCDNGMYIIIIYVNILVKGDSNCAMS